MQSSQFKIRCYIKSHMTAEKQGAGETKLPTTLPNTIDAVIMSNVGHMTWQDNIRRSASIPNTDSSIMIARHQVFT